MEVVLATRNRNKIREIEEKINIPALKFLTLDDFEKFPEVVEDKPTIKGNAAKKAREVGKFTKKISIADDTGLEVDFLKGAPGVYSARFAGEGCSYLDNNKKLLKLLKGVEDKNRKARFITVIAISDGGKKPVLVKGVCSGKISAELKGAKGFGYDPVFIPSDHNKSYAEMSLALKNKISHRGKALDKAKWLLLRLIKRQKDL